MHFFGQLLKTRSKKERWNDLIILPQIAQTTSGFLVPNFFI